MNKYLLLRDNKQSGPFTVQELQSNGFKPYDLVWLEGQSAAWRYPSEITELKAFAPTIEEQPFDRFYKKGSEHPITTEKERVIEKSQVNEIQPRKAVEKINQVVRSQPKKIYVTLPGSNNVGYNKPLSENGQGISSDKEKPVFSNSKLGNDNFSNDDRGLRDKIVTPNGKYQPSFTNTTRLAEQEKISRLSKRRSPDRGGPLIIATCLLLVGVGIGLAISYFAANTRNNKFAKFQPPAEKEKQTPLQNDQSILYVPIKNDSVVLPQMNVYQESNKLPISESEGIVSNESGVNQAAISPLPKKKIHPVRNKSIQKTVPAANTGALTEKPQMDNVKDESPKKSDVSIESARKNIIQHLSVENNKYKTGLLGGVSDLKLFLTNKSSFQLEIIEVEVNYLSPEKRVVKTQLVKFYNVSPGQQTSVAVPKSNRGVEITYSVKNIVSKD